MQVSRTNKEAKMNMHRYVQPVFGPDKPPSKPPRGGSGVRGPLQPKLVVVVIVDPPLEDVRDL